MMNEISKNAMHSKMALLISEMINSANNILMWCENNSETDIASEGYPQSLPSFDEFLIELIEWRGAQEIAASSIDK